MLTELADALAERDTGRALVAVAQASDAGRDPQRLAVELWPSMLRQGFLSLVAPELVDLWSTPRARRSSDLARRMGLPAVVRPIEVLGEAQVGMRDAPDPRIHLEVALVRLTHPEADDTPAALLERIERLEQALGERRHRRRRATAAESPGRSAARPVARPAGPPPAPATATGRPRHAAVAGRPPRGRGPELARRALGALPAAAGPRPPAVQRPPPCRRPPAPAEAPAATIPASASSPSQHRAAEPAPSPGPAPSAGPTPGTVTASGQARPPAPREVSSDDLVQPGATASSPRCPNRARARFRVGRFVAVEGGTAVYALPERDPPVLLRGGPRRRRAALSEPFRHARRPCGWWWTTTPTHDGPSRTAASRPDTAGAARPTARDDEHPTSSTRPCWRPRRLPAGAGLTPEERLKQAFPGREEV